MFCLVCLIILPSFNKQPSYSLLPVVPLAVTWHAHGIFVGEEGGTGFLFLFARCWRQLWPFTGMTFFQTFPTNISIPLSDLLFSNSMRGQAWRGRR